MGFIASFFSGLKAEVEWLITSLAVAPATNESAAAQDGAPAGAAPHHDVSAPSTHSAVFAVADQQTDSAPAADPTPAQHASADDVPAWTAQDVSYILPHADNLAIPADVTPDAPAPTPLTPLSLTDNFSATDVLTPADASPQGYQNVSLPGAPVQDHAESHWTLPNSGAGDFALASLVPFAKGGTNAQHGGGGGGTPFLIYHTGVAPQGYTGHDVYGGINSPLNITLSFDASVANAPRADANGFGFVTDLEDVAKFFAHNFSNAASITIDVGYGEINGAHVSSSVLGESETYYPQVPVGNYGSQYAALQAAYSAHASVALPATDPFSGSQTLEVEPAQGKALAFANASAQNYPVDGWIGFGAGSGLFFYNPADYASNPSSYDFMGTAAHEVSEILGRETWNGTKSAGAMQFLPLDFFHFADSNGAPIYSGTTAGHFSLSQGGAILEEYNTSSAGDYSDWAVPQPAPFTTDAFDWAGGKGAETPVSYADYQVMEAVGYHGTFSGTWDTTNWWLN